MDTAIIVAIITSVGSFLGVLLTNINSNKTIENKIVTAQAVTDTKLEALTAEVQKHNNFAQRVPVLETKVQALESDVACIKQELNKK